MVDGGAEGAVNPRAGAPDHERDAAGGRREEDGALDAVEPPLERHALAREQPRDDRERLLEPGHLPVGGEAERLELGVVPARAEAEAEAAAGDLVDPGRHPCEEPRRVERGRGDERPELDALRGRGQRGEQRPGVPRAPFLAAVAAVEQVVADPDRVESGLLGRPGDREQLGPAHLALDLGELYADAQPLVAPMAHPPAHPRTDVSRGAAEARPHPARGRTGCPS